MRPTQLLTALRCVIPTRQPVMVEGRPGCGKSEIVHQAARESGRRMIDVRAVLMDPVDIHGLPSVKNGRATWCPPSFWPLKGKDNGGPGVIFLDELPQAPPATQAALLQGVLDHRIGEAELDPEWTWVAAGNRQEDRAGANRMITPLLNRFLHLSLEVSTEDWDQWAITAGIIPEVRSFIRWRPSHLDQFDATSGVKAFATPRSWSFVSRVLPNTPPALVHSIVAGCVGEGCAAEFCAFVRLFNELPDMDLAMANPKAVKIPTKADVLHAFCGAISEKVRGEDVPQDRVDAALEISLRVEQDEFSLHLIRDVFQLQSEKFKSSKHKGNLIKRHKGNLTDGAGR